MARFDDITSLIDRYVSDGGPGSLCDEEPMRLFSEIIDRSLHVSKLNSIVAGLDTPEVIKMVGSRDYIILHATEHSTWAFTRCRDRPRTVSLTPVLSISAKLGGSSCVLETLRPDRVLNNEVFDPDASLVVADRTIWTDRAVVAKRSIEEVQRFAFDGSSGPVYLRVNSGLLGNFEWVFDAGSGRAKRHVCVRPGESNLVTMLDLIADVASSASIPFVLPYTSSELHFVRWKAISTICSIDERQGLPLVRAAADDPHPDVRKAAAATLLLHA